MAEEEVIKKKKTSASLNNAMKKLNKAEEVYARLIISMSNKVRLKLYRKIASLMKNRFSLMDALDMLHDGASNGGKTPASLWLLQLPRGGDRLTMVKPFPKL